VTITEITERIAELQSIPNLQMDKLKAEQLEIFKDLLNCRLVAKYFMQEGNQSERDIVANLVKEA